MTEAEKLRPLEDRLWKAADQLRANSSLAASQCGHLFEGLDELAAEALDAGARGVGVGLGADQLGTVVALGA